MKYVGYAQPGFPLKQFTAGVILDAWRHITRAEINAAFRFGVAVFLYHVIVWSFGMLQRPSLPHPLIATFMRDQLGAFTLMLAVVVANRATGSATHRRAAYAVAVVVSAAVMAPLGSIPAVWFVEVAPYAKSIVVSTLYMFCEWLVLAGAATFVYVDRRRARAARARMHAAELERTRTAKRTLESRLQAMQARVEPQFLFNTLAQVHELYRADPTHGERMLDELIAYLRAAMPRMRDTSSTVGQEIELVRAYLGIVRLRLGERLSFEIETPKEIADARMPPMMLLPLVDHAIAHGLAEPQATGSICIRSSIVEHTIRLEIADSGDGFLPDNEGEGIASIRERLTALYGSNASLVLQKRAGTTQAVLELPFEGRSQRADTFVLVDAPAPSSSAVQSVVAGT